MYICQQINPLYFRIANLTDEEQSWILQPDGSYKRLKAVTVKTRALMLSQKRLSSRIAIIDVGSNSVRLVVYDGLTRAPAPILNEKVMCGLGRDPQGTGRLSPDGVEMALRALSRFAALTRAMAITKVDVIATAAVRIASDGAAFCARVRQDTGFTIRVIDGPEEARLAALGVISGEPGAGGIVGDIGGGSLELALIDGGQVKDRVSLPLGALRLATLFPDAMGKAWQEIEDHLDSVPWLSLGRNKPLYAVGGSWRAIAKLWAHKENYPLSIVHNMALTTTEALPLVKLVARQNRITLASSGAVSRRRLESLPYACQVMARLLVRSHSASVIFSGHSLREGWMYENLPAELQKRDPLIEACTDFAEAEERFELHADELFRWSDPLFKRETLEMKRLRTAACIIGDVGWMEHPDYRAGQSYYRILRHPFLDLKHRDRVFLAFAVACRYASEFTGDAAVSRLLDKHHQTEARLLGLTLRLGHTLSGGARGVLPFTELELSKDELRLHFYDDATRLVGEVVEKRLSKLARLLDRTGRICIGE